MKVIGGNSANKARTDEDGIVSVFTYKEHSFVEYLTRLSCGLSACRFPFTVIMAPPDLPSRIIKRLFSVRCRVQVLRGRNRVPAKERESRISVISLIQYKTSSCQQ